MSAHRAARAALVAGVAAALMGAAAGMVRPARADDRVRLGPPALGASGKVEWAAAPTWERPLLRASALDSQRLWTAVLRHPGLAPLAHVRLAELAWAAGDTAALRVHAAGAAHAPPPWEWPALIVRLRDAGARSQTAAARAALRAAEPASLRWIPEERVALLQQSIRFALAAGDRADARRLATDLLRSAVAVSSIERGAQVLDSLVRASAQPLTARERRVLAAAEVRAGKPQQGASTLRPLLADVADPSPTYRTIGEYERRAARWREARRALDAALSSATGPADSSAAWLERARLSRAQGRTPDALAEYGRAAPRPPSDETGATALWERGQLAMSAARWPVAAESFARLGAGTTPRAAEARVRAGLGQLAGGQLDAAVATWSNGADEGSRFWWASGRRMQARARGSGRDTLADAALASLAATPGYTFYRVAARETLAIRGWPAAVARAHCAPDSACTTLQDAGTLAAMGAEREALTLLFQVFGRVPGAVPGAARTREARLEAARLGYAMGEPFHAARWAREAAWNGEQPSRIAPSPGVTPSRDPSRWAFEPWMAPPAWQSLVLPVADSLALEPELVWAVMELESRFQWDARSPSGATGLMQLLLPAASDAARWARERRPGPAALLDPASNLRYGARYLAWLLRRFEGHVSVALSAYNAGPSTVPPHWQGLVARGGEALFAEIASNEDAQFYAKWIVAGLRAYRDARPREIVR